MGILKNVWWPDRLSRWIGVELEDVPPFQIRLARASDGRTICTGLRIGEREEHDPEGPIAEREIQARTLRQIPLGQVVDELTSDEYRAGLDEHTLGYGRELLERFVPERQVTRRRIGPRGWPMEHWQRVAELYREALARRPRNPHRYIAEHFPTTEQTSRRWVLKCRDLGLIGGAQAGKAGEAPEDRDHLAEGGSHGRSH
jgi:hypothetical protein